MEHIHYSAITSTLELTFSKPTQVSVTGKELYFKIQEVVLFKSFEASFYGH